MAIPTQKTTKEPDYLRKIYLIYGPPKIGKSTLTSNLGDDANKILFFPTEAGHKELEIFKWQKEIKDAEGKIIRLEDPTTWQDFKDCVIEMTKQTEFKILAIDVADNLFEWCTKTVLNKEDVSHESDLGYGKGYKLIAREFFPVVNYLSQKGYGIAFISHLSTSEKEVKRKKIHYTDSSLNNTAKKLIHGMCDYIFACMVDDEGNRIIVTKGTENINAGDRSGRLSASIPLEKEGKTLKAELTKV